MDKAIDLRIHRRNDVRLIRKGSLKKIIPFTDYRNAKSYLYLNHIHPLNALVERFHEGIGLVLCPYQPKNYQTISKYLSIEFIYDLENIPFTSEVRFIFLENPSPITGRTYSEEEMNRILNECEQRRIYLIADESEAFLHPKFKSPFQKRFKDRYLLLYRYLPYRDKGIGLLIGHSDILFPIRSLNLITDKSYAKLAFYFSKKRYLKQMMIEVMEFNKLIKEYCTLHKVIFMKDSNASFMAVNIPPCFFYAKDIYVIKGTECGLGENYSIISMRQRKKAQEEVISRISN